MIKNYQLDIYMKGKPVMTKLDIERMEILGLPMPNRFTGKWNGQHFYKGRRWYGPTNRVGQKRGIIGGKQIFLNALKGPE